MAHVAGPTAHRLREQFTVAVVQRRVEFELEQFGVMGKEFISLSSPHSPPTIQQYFPTKRLSQRTVFRVVDTDHVKDMQQRRAPCRYHWTRHRWTASYKRANTVTASHISLAILVAARITYC